MGGEARQSRYVPRTLDRTVLEAMASARVVALLGPRQAGKSTLARRLATERLGADYVTLDDPPTLELAAADPAGFIAGQRTPVVIDEIQRAPKLLLAIKARVDRDDAPGQFLITGSANLRRLPTVPDALPGRVDYLALWPFTQGEIDGVAEGLLERLFGGEVPQLSQAPVGRHAYLDRLLAGGFPEALRRPETARARFFESYVQSIVDRDVADASKVRDPGAVGTVLRLVASRSGSLARYEGLGRDAGVDGKTAKSHVEALERLFLVRVRRPWHVNLGKREVKAPKLYVADTGLLAALIGADEQRLLADGGLAGALFETFVATELERQAAWAPQPLTFWHYRADEREVDVIVERPSGEIVGIEVKASATVGPRDFAGLAHLRSALGDRLAAGVVLYTGERTLPAGDGLWAVPLQALWDRSTALP
ncbi:MAG: ATP-binding protein [Solirubrobacterales bacterium]|nr:ATP-binding protein [Solirubrobacterales bacterium]